MFKIFVILLIPLIRIAPQPPIGNATLGAQTLSDTEHRTAGIDKNTTTCSLGKALKINIL